MIGRREMCKSAPLFPSSPSVHGEQSLAMHEERPTTPRPIARTGVPQATAAATYNVNNLLTNWKGAALKYDANGNLLSDGTNTYTWNARNQLSAISGGVSASFQYDASSLRVSKTISGTMQYLYDGSNPVQEISGTTASANLLTGGSADGTSLQMLSVARWLLPTPPAPFKPNIRLSLSATPLQRVPPQRTVSPTQGANSTQQAFITTAPDTITRCFRGSSPKIQAGRLVA
jgi:hypothetical protein